MSKDLLFEFTRNMEAANLTPQERVLIAVSGGPDSMALLHLFLRWDAGRVGVFHLNHGFRAAAVKEAQLVESYASQRGVPAHIIAYDVDAYLKESGESKQQGARRIRYQLLGQLARKQNYQRIALGHHGDDQAETVLMRLLRGSGLTGLGGIPARRGLYLRPLLTVSKEEILAYCQVHNIPFAEDATNRQPIYLRNKIRQELIPLLEREYNPEIRALLRQTAELLQTDELELERLAQGICQQNTTWDGGQLAFAREVFSKLSLSMQRRVLRNLLYSYQGHLLGIDFAHIENWRALLLEKATFELHLPQVAVSANANYIFVGAYAAEKWQEQELRIPGSFETEEFAITAELFGVQDLSKRPLQAEDFDYQALELPLMVRRRQPGDRLQPFGGTGSKKVKDLLIDARIPAARRDFLPIIADQKRILWVPPLRRSSVGALGEKTRQVVRLTFSSRR